MAQKTHQLDTISNNIIKAQDIISELMVALDFEKGGDIAKNLFSIYVYMNRELLNANINKDSEPLKRVKKLLMELREAWNEVAEKSMEEKSTPSKGSGINIAG